MNCNEWTCIRNHGKILSRVMLHWHSQHLVAVFFCLHVKSTIWSIEYYACVKYHHLQLLFVSGLKVLFPTISLPGPDVLCLRVLCHSHVLYEWDFLFRAGFLSVCVCLNCSKYSSVPSRVWRQPFRLVLIPTPK